MPWCNLLPATCIHTSAMYVFVTHRRCVFCGGNTLSSERAGKRRTTAYVVAAPAGAQCRCVCVLLL